jgi:hypothetical protein
MISNGLIFMTSVLPKFIGGIIAAAVMSWIAYPILCWVFIFPLGQADADVAPRQAFHEAMVDMYSLGLAFAAVQLVSCLCAVRLVMKASFRLVVLVGSEVPVIILLLSFCVTRWLSFAWLSFSTPMRAIRIAFLAVALTFALLYTGTRIFGSTAPGDASNFTDDVA